MGSINGNMTYGGLSGFGITWKKFSIWIVTFIVLYHLIGGFGGRYVSFHMDLYVYIWSLIIYIVGQESPGI